jgi:hypothetical protein
LAVFYKKLNILDLLIFILLYNFYIIYTYVSMLMLKNAKKYKNKKTKNVLY